jgi:hypothetical protein
VFGDSGLRTVQVAMARGAEPGCYSAAFLSTQECRSAWLVARSNRYMYARRKYIHALSE